MICSEYGLQCGGQTIATCTHLRINPHFPGLAVEAASKFWCHNLVPHTVAKENGQVTEVLPIATLCLQFDAICVASKLPCRHSPLRSLHLPSNASLREDWGMKIRI